MRQRKHYLYTEKLDAGGSWRMDRRIPCSCHIDENHWVERPVPDRKAA